MAAGRKCTAAPDLRYNLEISLEQAANGFDTTDSCAFLGYLRHLSRQRAQSRALRLRPAPPVTDMARCGCSKVFSASSKPARRATAKGTVIAEPCSACSGAGKIKRNKTLEVKIPSGIDDGMRIRSSGNGEPGQNGGPPGDLYVEVHIKPHQIFQRDGDDLHCELPISFAKAALGGDIEVPTLGGKVAFTVPEGTQTGKVFRLRGKGIKGVRSGHIGDLFCHVSLETPVKLTDRQKELLQELEKLTLEGGRPRHSPNRGNKSWKSRVKEFFE